MLAVVGVYLWEGEEMNIGLTELTRCYRCKQIACDCGTELFKASSDTHSPTIIYPEVEALRYLIAEQKKEIESLRNQVLEFQERYNNVLVEIQHLEHALLLSKEVYKKEFFKGKLKDFTG